MTAITSVLVILLTYFYFRNVKELLMALVPVVTGIVWLFGLMSIFGIAFNLSTLITGIALMGICVDYGIFMVYRCRYNLKSGIVMAVALSAIATLIGTGVLILADHPALFYVGLTMTVGIGAGYLSSLLVIPQLYRLLLPLREEKQ
jgi:predicted RND superfamily exporter protein